MVRPAAAPFSHLPISAPSTLNSYDNTESRLNEVTKNYNISKKNNKEGKVRLQQSQHEAKSSLQTLVRKLHSSSPTDNYGHWMLKLMLTSQHSTSTRVTLLQQTHQSLQQRRASARQDFDKRKMILDKRSIFTKEANEVRTNNGMSVTVHRKHNLTKVLKDVKLNSRRRRGLAPGDATDKIQKMYAPKLPSKYKVMAALEQSQYERTKIDEVEERRFRKILRKASMVRKHKILTGGGSFDAVTQESSDSDSDSNLDSDYSGNEDSVASSIGFGSVSSQARRRKKKHPMRDPNILPSSLPSLQERYGMSTDQFTSEPVCLKYASYDSVDLEEKLNEMEKQLRSSGFEPDHGGNDEYSAMSQSTAAMGLDVQSFDSRKLKKRNIMLLKNLQIPDPRINNNLVRAQLAKHSTSMVDVEKFKEVENDHTAEENAAAQKNILLELEKYYRHKSLGVGREKDIVPFKRRRKVPEQKEDNLQYRMDNVWSAVALCEAHLKLDTDLMFLENPKLLGGGDDSLVQEYVLTFEILVDSLFHLQVIRLKYDEQVALAELDKKEEEEKARLGPNFGKAKKEEKKVPGFMKGPKSSAKSPEKKNAESGRATAACLPNESIVYLMNHDLYLSPTPEHTPVSWLQIIALDVLQRANEDSGRIRNLSKRLGNTKVYPWMKTVIERYLGREIWGVEEKVKKKEKVNNIYATV
ncbi:hypothetical protein TrLO_g11696 [Triparma laevis f. longispina]|uniref:Uncharacterized protein n=1 Tax=Triparma laevis f. longispina TaxID=1714387 RepID=A0A9W7F2X1_9STRA|nr:hypothetical protein TrLO_g11696 [Triparma laevis f. longispina]